MTYRVGFELSPRQYQCIMKYCAANILELVEEISEVPRLSNRELNLLLEHDLITQEEHERLIEISAEARYEFGCKHEYNARMRWSGVFPPDWALLHRLIYDPNVIAVALPTQSSDG